MSGDGRERGAALVEYVLLVALVALVGSASIDFLGYAADARYERTADGVSGDGTWSSPGGSGGGTEGGGDGGSSSPSTTNPPATTTTPPATTTTTTTTTTAPASRASATPFASSSWSAGWFRWAGSATFVIADGAGRPVPGATVEVRVTTSTGAVRTATVTTGPDGRALVEVGPYDWLAGWGGTGHVDVAVTGVEVAGADWDGSGPTTRVSAP